MLDHMHYLTTYALDNPYCQTTCTVRAPELPDHLHILTTPTVRPHALSVHMNCQIIYIFRKPLSTVRLLMYLDNC